MSELKQRTQDICDQLQCYGLQDPMLADVLQDIVKINDAIGDGLSTEVLRAHIQDAKKKLDKLAQRG